MTMAAVLWTVAILAAAVVVGLVAGLWRRRRAEDAPWTTQERLMALGIVVALLSAVISALAAERTASGSPPEVTDYRERVVAACVSLDANAVPLGSLPDEHGNVHRATLLDALNRTIDASFGILDALWAEPVPEQLAEAATEARDKGAVWLFVSREDVNALADELPETMSFEQALQRLQQLDQQSVPNASAFLGAMSALAGQRCVP